MSEQKITAVPVYELSDAAIDQVQEIQLELAFSAIEYGDLKLYWNAIRNVAEVRQETVEEVNFEVVKFFYWKSGKKGE